MGAMAQIAGSRCGYGRKNLLRRSGLANDVLAFPSDQPIGAKVPVLDRKTAEEGDKCGMGF